MIEVGFKLTRRYTLIVLSIYLPSLMLLAIGYSTLYVQVSLLEVRLVVALTTLLVLYTFFNQTSSSLPQTAYVKLIDIWFFFCTIFLFVIIILHVFVERFDDNDVTPIVSADGHAEFLKPTAERFTNLKKLISSGDRFLKTFRTFVGPVVLSIFFLAYLLAILA
ncbi:glycine receptor subunit alpha-2-like [Macrobrachium rosenbergii]|uniref:glycine receptor subunit alpha-2-like n=1 Tax=Macrobrachium rosenbergii TaxID=79674 RepID=UPI0034D4ABE3